MPSGNRVEYPRCALMNDATVLDDAVSDTFDASACEEVIDGAATC